MRYRIVARAIDKVLLDVQTTDRSEADALYGKAAVELPECELQLLVDGRPTVTAGPSLRKTCYHN